MQNQGQAPKPEPVPEHDQLDIEDVLESGIFSDEEMTEKQRRIAAAAIAIFSNKGFSGTSTQEIAKSAGVAEGTIFKHFQTKKQLLLKVAGSVVFKILGPFAAKDIVRLLQQDLPHFEDYMRAIYADRISFAGKNSQMLRLLMQEVPFHPELRELVAEFFVTHVWPRLQSVIERFQALGELRPIPSERIARILVSNIFAFVIFKTVFSPQLKEWNEAEELESTIGVLLRGIKN